MQVSFDPKAPENQGVNYAGIDTGMVGKPSRDTTTRKWDEIILGPDAVEGPENAKVFKGNRAIRVTSLGQATPCTLGDFVRQTTNGNYIVKVTLDSLPADVKAIRKAIADAQKADYKANGPKARTSAPKAPVAVPTVPGMVQAVVGPKAPTSAKEVSEVEALKAQLAIALAALKAPTSAPSAPKAPSVPTSAPKAPKAK